MNDSGKEIEQAPLETGSEKDTGNESTDSSPEYFPVSEGKLMTLYILSFGLYGIYWFYRNWQLQQPRMDKKIFPMMRAIFSIFFTHSLFRRIDKSAENLKKEHRFNANALATFFVAAVVLGNLMDRLPMSASMMDVISSNAVIITSLIIFLISVYPLIAVQATVNRINNDILGYLNHRYSLWNYLLIISGSVLWILVVLGLLAESIGLVPPE